MSQSIHVPASAKSVTISGWIHNSLADSHITGYGYIHGTLLSEPGTAGQNGGGTTFSAPNSSHRLIDDFDILATLSSGWINVIATSAIHPEASTLEVLLARRTLDGLSESGNIALFDNISVTFHCASIAPTSFARTAPPSVVAPSPAQPPTAVAVSVGSAAPELQMLDKTDVPVLFNLDFDEIVPALLADQVHQVLVLFGVRREAITRLAVFPGSVIVVVTLATVGDAVAVSDLVLQGRVTVTPDGGPTVTAVRATKPPTAPPTDTELETASAGDGSRPLGISGNMKTAAIIVGVIVVVILVVVSVTTAHFHRTDWNRDVLIADHGDGNSNVDDQHQSREIPFEEPQDKLGPKERQEENPLYESNPSEHGTNLKAIHVHIVGSPTPPCTHSISSLTAHRCQHTEITAQSSQHTKQLPQPRRTAADEEYWV
jgi:hypothetical protein